MKTVITFVTVLLLVVGGNRLIQTYLGYRVLEQSGLSSLEFDHALHQAQEQNKPILMNVSAIYCPTCRKLDKSVFSDTKIKRTINDQFVFSRVEYGDEASELIRERYDIRGFPTVLVLTKNGELKARLPLIFEPKSYLENLTQVL